ncbi:MAG: hypothetical protein FJY91_02610 [Candidatus Harrisonbacteria bacterium]|nr:hypothetical protein [Candidatus Harrisonbacteria bacterium]
MHKLTAIIIKGNPKFIESNQLAENFYKEIKNYLENLGYEVGFDAGEPHSIPRKTDLWIGHSRGCDRLAFAPEGTRTIALGSYKKNSINHPQDNTKDSAGPSEIIPNEFHYMFTEEMKKVIKEITEEIAKPHL